MVGVAIISHGRMCEGILDSVEMVAGTVEQMETVSLKPGMTPETYQEMLKAAVERLDTGAGVLVLADILGGTPFNSIAMLSQELHVQILTGMNMAMLITLALERRDEDTLDDLIQRTEEAGKNGIHRLKRQ